MTVSDLSTPGWSLTLTQAERSMALQMSFRDDRRGGHCCILERCQIWMVPADGGGKNVKAYDLPRMRETAESSGCESL